MNPGLKDTITEDGVWRIQKREKMPTIEVFKLEDTGHGDILSQNFARWRKTGLPDLQTLREQASQRLQHADGETSIDQQEPP